jgi:catechol 2,3-dioxygenase
MIQVSSEMGMAAGKKGCKERALPRDLTAGAGNIKTDPMATNRPQLPAGTTIGAVHLNIRDLEESVRFYEDVLGFRKREADRTTAWLGAGGSDLLVLSETDGPPRLPRRTGLYHFAILVPSRRRLAQSLDRLVQTETALTGASDHLVSEALYLDDPDGNGIEIYRDRPKEEWPYRNGRLHMATERLDLQALLDDQPGPEEPWTGLDPGTVIGHVHLHVAHLEEADRFYCGILGFEPMVRYGSAALFVSAGGYHHHLGLNTWAGVGAPPPAPGSVGLKHFVVRVPGEVELMAAAERLKAAGIGIETDNGGFRVTDPSGNHVRVTAT